MIWYLICRARAHLNVEVNPVVATAFIILQHYFRNETDNDYELFTLMVTALWSACKQNETFRTMQSVCKVLQYICATHPSQIVRSIVFGQHPIQDSLSLSETRLITECEFSLLQAMNYDFMFELPFTHFDAIKSLLFQDLSQDIIPAFQKQTIIDICLMICSREYLNVPPEVIAAAATLDSFGKCPLPPSASQWILDLQNKYGEESFNLALHALCFEKSRTIGAHPS